MKIISILLVVSLTHLNILCAQGCTDTVHVKGYYVVVRLKNEIEELQKKEAHNNTQNITKQQRIDNHTLSCFIPLDSIDDKHKLSFRLNHIWDTTTNVFISCEKMYLKYLTPCSISIDTNGVNKCQFPDINTEKLYQSLTANTGEVFEIYYMDAYWIKFKIKKGTIQETMVPSRIAETSITPGINEYNLYYFLKCDVINANPPIEDRDVILVEKSANSVRE